MLTTAYCLRTPFGFLVAGTLAEDKREAQGLAFDYLYSLREEKNFTWVGRFWKKWDPFIKARKRRGWHVVQVKLEEKGDVLA